MNEIPEVFAIFEQKLANVLSFTVVPLKSNDLKKAIAELLTYFVGMVERASKAESRIAELEAAQRWRVVADGESPETYKPVLTVDMSEATQIPVPAFYNPDTKCWSTHFKYDLWVTHWMPLPESPNDTQTDTFVYGKESEE